VRKARASLEAAAIRYTKFGCMAATDESREQFKRATRALGNAALRFTRAVERSDAGGDRTLVRAGFNDRVPQSEEKKR